jgi:hypothetical protein
MTNRWDRSKTNDESESGLSNTLPGHRAGSPSLLTLMGPIPKSAASFTLPLNSSHGPGSHGKDQRGYACRECQRLRHHHLPTQKLTQRSPQLRPPS